jgi:hypothetical protein
VQPRCLGTSGFRFGGTYSKWGSQYRRFWTRGFQVFNPTGNFYYTPIQPGRSRRTDGRSWPLGHNGSC